MKHLKNEYLPRLYEELTHLPDTGFGDAVFSIEIEEDKVKFTECCDGVYSATKSKADAIEMLQEIIDYIKES